MTSQTVNPSVEERLAALEAAVKELRQQAAKDQPQRNWLEQITGSFKDDPVFDEILRYGREFRRSDDSQDGQQENE
ncbi:hypothetical protein LEP3755_32160 [Leptolyngbya sp. NIES-3755]|nr:hypothetical protein LEP3755_32160 [Leptolyngbya sp. NIES-3755]